MIAVGDWSNLIKTGGTKYLELKIKIELISFEEIQ
jgi:hypothetical protein